LKPAVGIASWFKKGRARKKRPVTRDNIIIIIIIMMMMMMMHGQYIRNIDSLLVKKTLSYGCRWEMGRQKLKVK
jgi:hypothetical protein